MGQPKTPATIPHSYRLGKEFRHRSFRAGGQPARAQVRGRSRCSWVTAGDRSFPPVLARMWHATWRANSFRAERSTFAAWQAGRRTSLRLSLPSAGPVRMTIFTPRWRGFGETYPLPGRMSSDRRTSRTCPRILLASSGERICSSQWKGLVVASGVSAEWSRTVRLPSISLLGTKLLAGLSREPTGCSAIRGSQGS